MILITGAGSGLGAALARQYDSEGQGLLLSGRSQSKLNTLSDSLNNTPIIKTADLAAPQEVESLLDCCQQPPEMVVHCAGSGYFGALESQNPEQIEQLISNNLTSSIFLLRELVKRYKNEKVNVVVVMSTAAQVAKAGESTYCAVKWGVKALLESVRAELKGCPMKLIAVYPGGMATDFWPSSGKEMDTSAFMSADDAAYMLKQALNSAEHGYVSDITINRC